MSTIPGMASKTTTVSVEDAPKPGPDPAAGRVTSRHEVENAAKAAEQTGREEKTAALAAAQADDDAKAQAEAAAAAKAAATPEVSGEGGVLVRYLGSSDVFEDYGTGLRFVAGGTPHEVEDEDAERLLRNTGPYEQFERVSAGE